MTTYKQNRERGQRIKRRESTKRKMRDDTERRERADRWSVCGSNWQRRQCLD